MIDIEDALLMRAEFCGGFIKYDEYSTSVPYIGTSYKMMFEVIGSRVESWGGNPELAMWQSLLTREVLMTGGL